MVSGHGGKCCNRKQHEIRLPTICQSLKIFYLTIQFVVLFAHTRTSAMRWFWITTRSASCLHSHATRLRTRRPWRPVRPAAIHCTICHRCAHAFAHEATISWTGIVAGARSTQAAIMITRLGCMLIIRMLRAIVPFTPSRPTAIHCSR